MRKISFVLLFIALMCISGCGSESPTPEDSHSAYGDMVSSEERNDTEEIFKTESSEQSAVQTEAAEADESTTNETVSSEQAAEESIHISVAVAAGNTQRGILQNRCVFRHDGIVGAGFPGGILRENTELSVSN